MRLFGLMTTIFADAKRGVMVCDSKASTGETWFPCTKVSRVGDELIGFAGTFHEGERWLEWYRTKKGIRPKIENAYALVLGPEGLKFLESSGQMILIERGFHGIGSGGNCAIAAFMAGADPKKAVEIACQIDTGSGGAVHVHKLKA